MSAELRFAKPRPKILDRREAKQQIESNYKKVCKLVTARDCGLCRCCGKPGYEHHHIVPRSKGRRDTLENLVLLCKEDHQLVTHRVIRIVGSDANAKLTFVRDWE